MISIAKRTHSFLFLGIICATTTLAGTQVLWDESVNGPLANCWCQPTILPQIVSGTNLITGSVQIVPSPYGATTYPDEFVLSIPAGLQVEHVTLSSDITNLWIWIGDPGFSAQLGFVGITGAPANGDLLPQMGIGPLNSGAYGMYVENHAGPPSTARYQLSFETTIYPKINIQLTAGTVVLHWPASANNYTVEATTSLSPNATWRPVTNAVSIVAGEYVVSDAVTETTKLYRLKR